MSACKLIATIVAKQLKQEKSLIVKAQHELRQKANLICEEAYNQIGKDITDIILYKKNLNLSTIHKTVYQYDDNNYNVFLISNIISRLEADGFKPDTDRYCNNEEYSTSRFVDKEYTYTNLIKIKVDIANVRTVINE